MKYKASINNHFELSFGRDAIDQLDVIPTSADNFHILLDNKSYLAELISFDAQKKNVHLLVNGRAYEVHLSDKYDQLINKLGLEVNNTAKLKDVKAPMPGLVLDIAVQQGQCIQKGDKLLILEAMKMENVIKSEGEGIVKTIHIEQGTAVDKGQVLIEME